MSAVRRTGPPCRYDESSLVIWLDRDFLPECKVDSDLLSAHVKYTPRTSFFSNNNSNNKRNKIEQKINKQVKLSSAVE